MAASETEDNALHPYKVKQWIPITAEELNRLMYPQTAITRSRQNIKIQAFEST